MIEGWKKIVLQRQRLQGFQRHPHEHGRLHTQKGTTAIRVVVNFCGEYSEVQAHHNQKIQTTNMIATQ